MTREIEEIQAFLARQVGDARELRLMLANAIAGRGATDEEVDAGHQRVVELRRQGQLRLERRARSRGAFRAGMRGQLDFGRRWIEAADPSTINQSVS